ncbi:PREDICTED: uncharacterized protein LOC109130877 [Camelina sativa]|uniref:Uncharacterized protein LOC109130877 n=1 Tax=Camelina sativa TaxID=90675 RepID=A0ABM1RBW6_CAMSA|nr:PREDICTED: uncharacterized protein LOC109130877 [Camelina sativa]
MGPPTETTQNLTVSDLILPSTREWNLELIKHILPAYEKEIRLLKPSLRGAKDIWAWLPTKDSVYSAKSGYFESTNSEDKNNSRCQDNPTSLEDFNWHKCIWSLKTSPKTKLLLWKAAHNALPMGANLLHRSVSDSAKCPHCDGEETILHLLFQCPFAAKTWSMLPVKSTLRVGTIKSIKEGIDLANKLTCLPPTGVGTSPIAPWLLWSIWTTRNQLIFNKKIVSAEETLSLAMQRAKECPIALT